MAILNTETSIRLLMYSGLKDIERGRAVSLELREDNLRIQELLGKKKGYLIAYNQITNVQTSSETQIIEKDKSVIGRGIAGGLLFGPAGAVVGGLSGLGTKTETKHNKSLIVSFTSKNGGEREISLQATDATMNFYIFVDNLKKTIACSSK